MLWGRTTQQRNKEGYRSHDGNFSVTKESEELISAEKSLQRNDKCKQTFCENGTQVVNSFNRHSNLILQGVLDARRTGKTFGEVGWHIFSLSFNLSMMLT